MSDTQIRMRFTSTGLKQIRDDLRAAGQDSTVAMQKIGGAIDSPNKALGLTIRELQQVRAAAQAAGRDGSAALKQIDTQLKLAGGTIGASPVQPRAAGLLDAQGGATKARINALTGVSGESYSAAASASAFMELEKRASALRDALNPAAEAEKTFSAAVGEASQLLAAGAITEAEHAAAVAAAKREFQAAEHAARGMAGGVGLNRAQMMELGHVARSVADGLASGISPTRVFSMEGARLAQVMGEGNGGMSGILSKLPGILRGPIGLFGGLATVLLTAVGAERSFAEGQRTLERELIGAGRAYGGNVEQLERLAEQSALTANVTVGQARKMEGAFLSTGVIGAQQIGGLIRISRDYAAAMGLTADQATAELAKVFTDPAKGAAELNEKLHFLSDAQRQEIADLQESGDRTGAQTMLLNQLQGATDGAAQHLNILGQALHAVAVGFSYAWTMGGKFFHDLTHLDDFDADTKLKLLNAQLAQVRAAEKAGATQYQDSTTGQVTAVADRIRDLQNQIAQAAKDPRTAENRQANDLSTRAGGVIDALDPSVQRLHDLRNQLGLLQKEAGGGWKGLDADKIAAGRREIQALTNALKTFMPEYEKEQRLAEDQAKLAARPGAAARSAIQADMARVQHAGELLTAGEYGSLVASGQERGYNRGERVDQAAARKSASDARQAADAEREWTAAKAESLGVDHNLVDAENKLTDLRQRGAKITAAEAAAYLDAARRQDSAAAQVKADQAAKANRDWGQALSGVSHESANLDRAMDLLAKRVEDVHAKMAGATLPTDEERDRLIALAVAADRAADASKALTAAKSAVKDASGDVLASQPAPTIAATGRYDPQAAMTQWQNARVAIYAEAEAKIRADEQARVEAGEESEQQAAENTARAIAAIDAAYALQSVTEITAIKKKAAEDVVQHEEQLQQAFNNRIASAAGDFGSAVMKLTGGAKIGNVGRDLAKQLLQQILETLVDDPLVALIKQELQAVMSPQTAGAGGVLGMLSSGLRMAFGAPLGLTSSIGVSALPTLSDLSSPSLATGLSSDIPAISITPPGFASGTNSTPDGLRWVGESGPELEWGGGKSIMSAANSAGWIRDLQDRAAGGGSARSNDAPVLHYNPQIHMDATGADPAELKRTQDAIAVYQRQEPARVAAYLRAAKLR